MAVIVRMVFGDTAGLVAGGVTVGGPTMAAGNGSLARFVGFAASLLDEGKEQGRGQNLKIKGGTRRG